MKQKFCAAIHWKRSVHADSFWIRSTACLQTSTRILYL